MKKYLPLLTFAVLMCGVLYYADDLGETLCALAVMASGLISVMVQCIVELKNEEK